MPRDVFLGVLLKGFHVMSPEARNGNVMQSTQTSTKTASTMPFNKKDSSELDDLQAMASSAKRRRSQRLSSQMEAQDSLLQSNAVLDAVVLPDPSKSVSIAEVSVPSAVVAKESVTDSAMPAVAVAEPVPTASSSSSNKGLYVGIGLLAVGAVAAFLLLGGDTKGNDRVAEAAAVVEDELPPAVEAAPAMVVVEEEDEQTEDEATPEPTENVENVAAVAPKDTTPKKSPDKAIQKNADKPKVVKEKAVKKDSPKIAATPKPKPTKKPDASSSLDDVLSSVTGGVDKPIAAKEDEAPTKKGLGRGDVAKAMKRITPAAKSCYSVEEFSGMVKVKYSVAPDGSVSKASATGAHKGSKTGACVVRAVRKAKFPAFSGATMSFSFPFLLSP